MKIFGLINLDNDMLMTITSAIGSVVSFRHLLW